MHLTRIVPPRDWIKLSNRLSLLKQGNSADLCVGPMHDCRFSKPQLTAICLLGDLDRGAEGGRWRWRRMRKVEQWWNQGGKDSKKITMKNSAGRNLTENKFWFGVLLNNQRDGLGKIVCRTISKLIIAWCLLRRNCRTNRNLENQHRVHIGLCRWSMNVLMFGLVTPIPSHPPPDVRVSSY